MRFPRPGDSLQEEAFVINPLGQGRDGVTPPAGKERGQGFCVINTRPNDNCGEITTAYTIYNVRRLQTMNPLLDCSRPIPGGANVVVRADGGCGTPCYREWC
ncbi:hypothetical protein BV898_16989 [Hypsibius exemplaris]|uniref:Uncharacterized protein n=1 Tax=Hypsibius exemplaris TaxID=2072580 RepID=A0A9X6RM58_HYPEX|nr:hypothetical protein BV898_16989 [Hypsibius exemplaris]